MKKIKTVIITEDGNGDNVRTPALINPVAVLYFYEGFHYGTVVAFNGCCFLVDMPIKEFRIAMGSFLRVGKTYHWVITNNEAQGKIVKGWAWDAAFTLFLDTEKKYRDFNCCFMYFTDGQRLLTLKNIEAYETY